MIIALIFGLAVTSLRAEEQMIELGVEGSSHVGRLVHHNARECWLLERNGRLTQIKVNNVTGFRVLDQPFSPLSAVEMRSELRREFGTSFEIKGTSKYLVVATEGNADHYGEMLDQFYREFRSHFSVRGFDLPSPEFPMVAIVFPDQEEFANYAARDGIRGVAGLAGYYHRKTNRVALFDPTTSIASVPESMSGRSEVVARVGGQSGLKETLVHEATHQIAFNVGLHSRLGETPKWVIEGLATVFEHPDMRGAMRSSSPIQRINRERYVWFGNYARERRAERALHDLIATDIDFATRTLDAYSEAWAFSFFLMERRKTDYANYMQRISQRDSVGEYSAAERIRDFEESFGTTIQKVEVEFLRYIEGL
ncbi:DUF1570 domain-containing protein [Rubinisphaera margarita]|uniref:DUF1570 domain-containing protein n=1 Tax=Rubinisphaera margarita TaxID=2909586 RepID=UPI001EE7DC91|nr:DUF1570 domain-containing protein [Rubinisphaera margarita]MCG6157117.1 DUF1570 domain-containing protein [Rubinisphaera margarita]